MTESLTLDELRQIQNTLRFVLLPIKDLGLDWLIMKNLSKLDRHIKKKDYELVDLREKYTYKDESGKPINYVVARLGDNQAKFVFDDEGNFVIATDLTKQFTQLRINDTHPEFAKSMHKHNSEGDVLLSTDKKFEFHRVEKEIVAHLFEEGKLATVDVSILVGTFFEEI